jgi:hypothetical protein
VSREWGREVVSRTTFLVVETRTSVLVDVMTERREPPVEVEAEAVSVTVFVLIATPLLLTGVPFEQTTPLSFWLSQGPLLSAKPRAERAATAKMV